MIEVNRVVTSGHRSLAAKSNKEEVKKTIFDHARAEAKNKGYGSTKPSTFEIWIQWNYYIPPMYIQDRYNVNNKEGWEEIGYVMYPQLERMSRQKDWVITDIDGNKIDEQDFAQMMITGVLPFHDKKSKGGVLDSIEKYDPKPYTKIDGKKQIDAAVQLEELDGIRQYICPWCGESFWTEEANGPGPRSIRLKGRHPLTGSSGQRSCGGRKERVLPEEYPQISSDGNRYMTIGEDPYVLEDEVNKGIYYRYCGYPINIMSFASFLKGRMKNVRTEEFRYRMQAETKGRTPLERRMLITCPNCFSDIFDRYGTYEHSKKNYDRKVRNRDPVIKEDERRIECEFCGSFIYWDDPDVVVEYSTINPNIEIDRDVIPDEGKAMKIQDSIHEQLTENGLTFSEKAFSLRDQLITALLEYYAGDTTDDDNVKVKEVALFVDYHFREGLEGRPLTNLPEGELTEEEKSTLATLTERYFNTSCHYTICMDCKHKMNEPIEVSKFKKLREKSISYFNSLYGLNLSENDLTVGSRIQCERAVGKNKAPEHQLSKELINKIKDLSKDVQSPEEVESSIESTDWGEGLFDVSEPSKKYVEVIEEEPFKEVEEKIDNEELTSKEIDLLKTISIKDYKRFFGLNTRYHGESCECGAHGKIKINIFQDASRRKENVRLFIVEQYKNGVEPFKSILDDMMALVEMMSREKGTHGTEYRLTF